MKPNVCCWHIKSHNRSAPIFLSAFLAILSKRLNQRLLPVQTTFSSDRSSPPLQRLRTARPKDSSVSPKSAAPRTFPSSPSVEFRWQTPPPASPQAPPVLLRSAFFRTLLILSASSKRFAGNPGRLRPACF